MNGRNVCRISILGQMFSDIQGDFCRACTRTFFSIKGLIYVEKNEQKRHSFPMEDYLG